MVRKTAFKSWNVGDRVAGAVHRGLYPDPGAFAEYLRIDSDLAWKVLEGIDAATTSTYGISTVTASPHLFDLVRATARTRSSTITTRKWSEAS